MKFIENIIKYIVLTKTYLKLLTHYYNYFNIRNNYKITSEKLWRNWEKVDETNERPIERIVLEGMTPCSQFERLATCSLPHFLPLTTALHERSSRSNVREKIGGKVVPLLECFIKIYSQSLGFILIIKGGL